MVEFIRLPSPLGANIARSICSFNMFVIFIGMLRNLAIKKKKIRSIGQVVNLLMLYSKFSASLVTYLCLCQSLLNYLLV